MLYVSERFRNIYGIMQYKTLLKTEDWTEAEKFFKSYETNNEIEISDTNTFSVLAVKYPGKEVVK